MSRYAPSTSISYSFGPGPITTAVKWIIIANVAAFVVTTLFAVPFGLFGLVPKYVIERGWIWQLVTYMFLHGGALHILFNMLGIWMFGVELERRWGTSFFLKYYFASGIGGGLTFLLVSLLPFAAVAPTYVTPAVGASGALFGLLLAYAIYWPERPDPAGADVRAGTSLRDDFRRARAAEHVSAQPRRRGRGAPRRHDLRLPLPARRTTAGSHRN